MRTRNRGGQPADAQAAAAGELLLDTPLAPSSSAGLPLPADLPPAMFTGPGLLALADLLPVMTAYVDRDEVYRFVNKPYSEWIGIPRKQMLGITMRELLGERNYADRKPMIDAALAGERKYFAATYDHPERGTLALQVDYVPWIAPGDERPQGIVIVLNDVTEQRVAERAVRESEARFRLIANSAPALMWVTRIDRVRDFVNQAYADFACGPGCDIDEARTLDWRERIHPDDVDRIVAESIAGEASLQRFTLEGRYKRYDGEYRWLRTVSQPRFGPDGELVGFIGVGTDITLAKEAELELRRQVEEQTRELKHSEARFRAVFDTVLEVLVLMEPDGTVVELNRKEAPWRARNAREAVGHKIWDAPTLVNYPQHLERMKRAVREAASGQFYNEEVRMERDGSPTAVLDVSIQPVRDGDGKVIYLLFEARDITELKTAQEQLRQSQKMEALG
ncbi:MAG: PAS domain S-box protein, partial [Sphingomicrobium sp.]